MRQSMVRNLPEDSLETRVANVSHLIVRCDNGECQASSRAEKREEFSLSLFSSNMSASDTGVHFIGSTIGNDVSSDSVTLEARRCVFRVRLTHSRSLIPTRVYRT